MLNCKPKFVVDPETKNIKLKIHKLAPSYYDACMHVSMCLKEAHPPPPGCLNKVCI